MKISDAIRQLQEIRAIKGDIDVMSCDVPAQYDSEGRVPAELMAWKWDEPEIWMDRHPHAGAGHGVGATVVRIGCR